jgi:predicted transcriptional regulator
MDGHLTLRVSKALARALARRARERGVPRSQVVREAVAGYLAGEPGPLALEPGRVVTAAELAAKWRALPRLTAAEADDFAEEIEAARNAVPAPPAPWG